MKENVIQFTPPVRAAIPRKGGYWILDPAVVANIYQKLNNDDSIELYEFWLIPNSDNNKTLIMSGSLMTSDSSIKNAKQYIGTSQSELEGKMAEFCEDDDVRNTIRNGNIALKTYADGKITIVAIPCNDGFIVGGWHNSRYDADVAKHMLSYIIYGIAAFNNDDDKLKHVYYALPRNSKFVKFAEGDAKIAILRSIQATYGNNRPMPKTPPKSQYKSRGKHPTNLGARKKAARHV